MDGGNLALLKSTLYPNYYNTLGILSAARFPPSTVVTYQGKGEEYKLFWPPQPEFIRIAAKAIPGQFKASLILTLPTVGLGLRVLGSGHVGI